MVAIGTIADMVSLTGENRIWFSMVWKCWDNSAYWSTKILDMAGIAANEVTEKRLVFQIAPRLNALGRLDDPNPAIDFDWV